MASAGEPDVEQTSVLLAGGDDVRGVSGHALSSVHRAGVSELDMLADVTGRQDGSPPRSGVGGVEHAVGLGSGDGPAVAVGDPVGGGGSQAPVVVPGDDAVADRGRRAVDECYLVPGRCV
jgi:hypothetical protein